jgi:putative ABC transport system substrate-binding protein
MQPGFLQGLQELGFVEGRNVAIEYRWGENQGDRLAAMATDLVARWRSAREGDPILLRVLRSAGSRRRCG